MNNTNENILNKCDAVLDMKDPNFAKNFANAIGAKEGDTINLITPQFERQDGLTIKYIPKTIEEFDALKSMPDDKLRERGLQLWDTNHWLYPAEWYDFIPDGYEMVCISGEVEKFEKGVTDDDMRFGALAYGFIGVF
jgi:hypothetical protein